jgi:hypothetical protein
MHRDGGKPETASTSLFEFGLQAILDGIEARLTVRRQASRSRHL